MAHESHYDSPESFEQAHQWQPNKEPLPMSCSQNGHGHESHSSPQIPVIVSQTWSEHSYRFPQLQHALQALLTSAAGRVANFGKMLEEISLVLFLVIHLNYRIFTKKRGMI
jgi:hypothetical protein